MLLKSRSTSNSLILVLQVFEANCWLMEFDMCVLIEQLIHKPSCMASSTQASDVYTFV